MLIAILKRCSETDQPITWIREALRGRYTVILEARSRQGEFRRPVEIFHDQIIRSRFHGR